MTCLVISNGREFAESILLIEGETYVIDMFTTKCMDSDQIRQKKKKEFKLFQKTYPDGKNGAIRVFVPDSSHPEGIREWTVLYKKHAIAFQEIIQNEHFMRQYAKTERRKVYAADGEGTRYTDWSNNASLKYDLNGILHHSFSASVKRYVKRMKEYDKKTSGITGGGKIYFEFMRDIIFRYNEYIKAYSNMPTIDEIYKSHLAKLSGGKLQKTNTPVTNVPSPINIIPEEEAEYVQLELDPYVDYNRRYDEYLTPEEIDSMNIEDPYEFFGMPEFDRYYGGLFKNSHMILNGNMNGTQNREFYEQWSKVCDRCFDGVICCPPLGQQTELIYEFDTAKLIIICVDEDNRELKFQLYRTHQNEMPTIVICSDKTLASNYRRAFPKANVIYNSETETSNTIKQVVEVFIQLHNDEYKKGRIK